MSLSRLPKGKFPGLDSAIDKARAMIRQGKSEQFVSDYLGMELSQVRTVAAGMALGERCGRPRADTHEPLGPTKEDATTRFNAQQGSQALLRAIREMRA